MDSNLDSNLYSSPYTLTLDSSLNTQTHTQTYTQTYTFHPILSTYTLQPILSPYTLTLYASPYTLHPILKPILKPILFTLFTLYSATYTLTLYSHPLLFTLYSSPYSLHPILSTYTLNLDPTQVFHIGHTWPFLPPLLVQYVWSTQSIPIVPPQLVPPHSSHLPMLPRRVCPMVSRSPPSVTRGFSFRVLFVVFRLFSCVFVFFSVFNQCVLV